LKKEEKPRFQAGPKRGTSVSGMPLRVQTENRTVGRGMEKLFHGGMGTGQLMPHGEKKGGFALEGGKEGEKKKSPNQIRREKNCVPP